MAFMQRRLFLLLASLSFVAMAGAAVLWMRSYRICDQFGWSWEARSEARSAEMYTGKGAIGLAFVHAIDHRPNYNGESDAFGAGSSFFAEHPRSRPYFPNEPGSWGGHGFWLDLGDDTPGWRFQDNIRIVEAPTWSVMVAMGVLPALLLAGRLRRRIAPGACKGCGYDLRATPGRCPECGLVPAIQAAKS
jgi:hypothetical protein